jgi:hypothetical protein
MQRLPLLAHPSSAPGAGAHFGQREPPDSEQARSDPCRRHAFAVRPIVRQGDFPVGLPVRSSPPHQIFFLSFSFCVFMKFCVGVCSCTQRLFFTLSMCWRAASERRGEPAEGGGLQGERLRCDERGHQFAPRRPRLRQLALQRHGRHPPRGARSVGGVVFVSSPPPPVDF